MSIKLICSDCNGVLNNVDGDYSKTGWYSTISKDKPDLYSKIHKFIFCDNPIIMDNEGLIPLWMSGKLTYKDVNKILSNNLNIDISYLDEKLIESAKKLELDWNLIKIYQKFRKNDVKVFITSDNMDIFSLFTVPANNLNDYFDKIYNSFDLNCLKHGNDFELYRKIASENNLELSEVLIVDDSRDIIDRAKEIGFSTYLYNFDTYMNFEKEMYFGE